jgi:hypothetical protein
MAEKNMIRNAATLDRERKEYERTTKLQEKELQELLDRKRRKPVSVRPCYRILVTRCAFLCEIWTKKVEYQLNTDRSLTRPFFPFAATHLHVFFSCMYGSQIQVQILTGRKIVIYIDPYYDQLIDIKKKIQIKEGIHPDQMILFYNGVRLQENCNKSLDDVLYIRHHLENEDECPVNNNICLFLTLRNRGG